MTISPSRLLGRVLCPICLQWIHWRTAPRVEIDPDTDTHLPFRARGQHETREAFEQRRLHAQRLCTLMRDGTASTHYLPDKYGDYGDPIVIGLVGGAAAGKTLLLAAMVDALRNDPRLAGLGLTVNRLDERLDRSYMANFVEPFLHRRKQLDLTQISPITFSYAARVRSSYANREFAVAFFDVAGEQYTLQKTNTHYMDVSFLSAVSALLFVVDPEKALPGMLGIPGQVFGDPAFNAVVDRLIDVRMRRGEALLPIPAALVLGKADLLEGLRPEVRDWLSRPDDLDLATVAAESEDAYDFLARNGAERFLRPVQSVSDVTLHFASAAGTGPVNGEFPAEGFGPRRVLRPLLSLFAMTGIIDRSRLGD